MSRLSLFNSPLMLGFEQFEQAVDMISKTASDGYPPYNVEKVSENKIRITLAVAGFSQEDMQVQIENNQLVIKGKAKSDDDKEYLHRGIAARQFRRAFVLAEGIEVLDAKLENGLLHVDLEQPLQNIAIRSIEIQTSSEKSSATVIEDKKS
ncbi:heat-shock protein Hsp20 [Kiloniella litopenaei]|uniref:Heat-shock protein Hsp20 n=1 Tax=Kiloniella litopenaei TaxID=1549748 RepID=A0A0M2REG7_9PROT|nr:Hsp20 family protein [Kiloniella litopenaei]KKJ77963.1 heat-shock protein Hsp20 [Kiloniella litopenaei]